MADDNLILQQIHDGNVHAFDLIYEKYWAPAYAAAYKRLKDHDQAKDIVQEIFIHIWTKRESANINNFPAYLNIAIRNQVFKLLAKQKTTHPFFDILDNLPTTYLQADANILWKDFIKSYETLLNSLPKQRQNIFRMRFQDDVSTNDIAEQLGLSKKTIQNQLSMAFNQISISVIPLLSIFIMFTVYSF